MSSDSSIHDHDWGASVRTIIQSLILAGIVGLVTMVIQNGRDQAEADRSRSIQIATLQAQVAQVQAAVTDLPMRTTRLEANQQELIRRQNANDNRWDKLAESNKSLKSWQ